MDGGKDYLRRGAKNWENFEDTTLSNDEPQPPVEPLTEQEIVASWRAMYADT